MAMEDQNVLIVGGYGKVARTIAAQLAVELPGRVIVAGRDYQRASLLSDELHGRVHPLQLDVSSANALAGIPQGVTEIVMCVDQQGIDFVEGCIKRGIDYVDITAGYDFLSKVEALDPLAREHDSTVVLSVGLAPGVTNLLAGYAKSQAMEAEHVDLFVMLGLGEDHGEAAVRWTVERLSRDVLIEGSGKSRRVRASHEHFVLAASRTWQSGFSAATKSDQRFSSSRPKFAQLPTRQGRFSNAPSPVTVKLRQRGSSPPESHHP